MPTHHQTTTQPLPPWFKNPEPLQPTWQGPELALDQLDTYLNEIKNAEEPPRPDITDRAVTQGRAVVTLLRQWVESLPPGAIPATKHRPGEPALP